MLHDLILKFYVGEVVSVGELTGMVVVDTFGLRFGREVGHVAGVGLDHAEAVDLESAEALGDYAQAALNLAKELFMN